MSSINKRLSVYFKHHVVATIKVTPPPSNSNEVNHLFHNFKTIGNLEYFHMQRDRTKINTYGPMLSLVYNPTTRQSLLGSMLYSRNQNLSLVGIEKDEVLASKQQVLMDRLYLLLAIPRYSFIENDDEYSGRRLQIPFKHQLTHQGLKYGNRYELNTSTVDNQFVSIQTSENDLFGDFNDFKANTRFNFQKFHKFDNIVCSKGVESINSLIGHKKLQQCDTPVSNSQLVDLNYKFPVNTSILEGKGFQGFYS